MRNGQGASRASGYLSLLNQTFLTDTRDGAPSISMPMKPVWLFDDAGSSSMYTAMSWPLMTWMNVPPRAIVWLFDDAGSSSMYTAMSWPLMTWMNVPPRAIIRYSFQSLVRSEEHTSELQ